MSTGSVLSVLYVSAAQILIVMYHDSPHTSDISFNQLNGSVSSFMLPDNHDGLKLYELHQ